MPIPNEAWKCFCEWYGGGPEFERMVITGSDGKTTVELYPPVLYGMLADDNGLPAKDECIMSTVVSRKYAMGKVFETMKTNFGKLAAECRLWYRYMAKSNWTLVTNMDSTVEELGLASGDKLILETKHASKH
ncbi:MAG: DUSP domain-containing protein [Candidatus Pacebacteria bacterium]|nr:DUSP domain-containing protein [Candidatus Paceibacterota bacterium]